MGMGSGVVVVLASAGGFPHQPCFPAAPCPSPSSSCVRVLPATRVRMRTGAVVSVVPGVGRWWLDCGGTVVVGRAWMQEGAWDAGGFRVPMR